MTVMDQIVTGSLVLMSSSVAMFALLQWRKADERIENLELVNKSYYAAWQEEMNRNRALSNQLRLRHIHQVNLSKSGPAKR